MEKLHKIEQEKCPNCGKVLPITVIKIEGKVAFTVFCKHCKQISVMTT